MSRLHDIERAVAALPAGGLNGVRDGLDRCEAERFDARLSADAASSRLDRLAAEALDDVARGRARPARREATCRSIR